MRISSGRAGYRFADYRPVTVTGMGFLGAAASGAEAFKQFLYDGGSAMGYLQGPVYTDGQPLIGAALKEDGLLENFLQYEGDLCRGARRLFRISGLSVKASALAAAEAWQQAKLNIRKPESQRIGLILAGSNISPAVSYAAMAQYREQPELLHPRYALNYMDTYQLGVLSEMFAIHGEAATAGGASASGNTAVLRAAQLIQLGIADICMVIGPLAELSPLELQAFLNIGAYGGRSFHDNPSAACRPFDSSHEGFIFGQASACLILEGADSAAAREAEVLATIAGGAVTLDGHSLSDPSEDGQVRTMELALHTAGLAPDDIDYINAHGTSTPLGDLTELSSISQVFGSHVRHLRLNSTKALTGHCLYAAGVVEAVATIIQQQGKFLHPLPNLENPVSREPYYASRRAEQASLVCGLSNSYGFGGINTGIIIRKGAS
ncbi:beta-ketoacyl synthase N-terminal-like domain-containing protein [Paenibacillus piscarius]|uniref:beta-ketoacyl synthase N-terminal-like domain-containing protein n=1 Tax=Paenibacillus piscarius TaxID=1089681 RepID=UPI001EE8E582|nr:beta-ketoacyl synthase N-terminal-like domain-containing protein [Paenibacillus piscarius]